MSSFERVRVRRDEVIHDARVSEGGGVTEGIGLEGSDLGVELRSEVS